MSPEAMRVIPRWASAELPLALVLVVYLQLFRAVRPEMREVGSNVHVRLERPALDGLGSPVAQRAAPGAGRNSACRI
jgi:hypothetical protein